MVIRTTNDIPEEIKNIVELFYLRGRECAQIEIDKLKENSPEMTRLLQDVVSLFDKAPESLYMFYNDFITLETQHELDEELPFSMGNLIDGGEMENDGHSASESDAPDSLDLEVNSDFNFDFDHFIEDDLENSEEIDEPVIDSSGALNESDLEFSELLEKSLEATTQVPSIYPDASGIKGGAGSCYGKSGRKLSAIPDIKHDEINLDIDLDFNFFDTPEQDSDEENKAGNGGVRLVNSIDVSQSVNNAMTPVPVGDAGLHLEDPLTISSLPGQQEAVKRFSDKRPEPFGSDENIRMTRPDFEPVSQNISAQENRRRTATVFGFPGALPGNNCPTVDRLTPVPRDISTRSATRENENVDEFVALSLMDPKDRIPRLICKLSELSKKKGIDSKAGFILSMIDGQMTIADILDVSSWSEAETAKILVELQSMGIIEFSSL